MDPVLRNEQISLEARAPLRKAEAVGAQQRCDGLQGSSAEQKSKPGFADSWWHILLTLYAHIWRTNSSSKKTKWGDDGLEK